MICVMRLRTVQLQLELYGQMKLLESVRNCWPREATSAVSKATRAIKRGKLADIKIVVLLQKVYANTRATSWERSQAAAFTFNGAVSDGSSMIWILQDSHRGAKITLEVTTRFFRVSNKRPTNKHTLNGKFFHQTDSCSPAKLMLTLKLKVVRLELILNAAANFTSSFAKIMIGRYELGFRCRSISLNSVQDSSESVS